MNTHYYDIDNRRDYSFDCPVGTWRARLDAKAWGKKSNLLLYVTEEGTGRKFVLSVFWTRGHQAEGGGTDFKDAGEPGDVLELQTDKTRTGMPKLLSAKVLAASSGGSA